MIVQQKMNVPLVNQVSSSTTINAQLSVPMDGLEMYLQESALNVTRSGVPNVRELLLLALVVPQ